MTEVEFTVDADSYMVKAVAGIIVDEAHEMTDPQTVVIKQRYSKSINLPKGKEEWQL